MATQEIIETFRNHGVQVEEDASSTQLVWLLREIGYESLWPIVEDFYGSTVDVVFVNKKMATLTTNYVLVDVFENNKTAIVMEDIEAAKVRATKIAESMWVGSSTRTDQELAETATGSDSSEDSGASTRKHDRGLKPLIESLVESNPKAKAAQIIEMVHESKPEAKDATIKVYYSQARNSLGLPSLGRRGRKSSGLYPAILKMVRDNPEISKDEVFTVASEKFGAKESTVNIYFGKAQKEVC